MGKSLVSCFFLRHSVYKSACFKSSSPETHKFSWGNTAGLETPGLTPSARFVDIPISDVSHYRRAWACGGRVSWSPRAGGHRADILAASHTAAVRSDQIRQLRPNDRRPLLSWRLRVAITLNAVALLAEALEVRQHHRFESPPIYLPQQFLEVRLLCTTLYVHSHTLLQ